MVDIKYNEKYSKKDYEKDLISDEIVHTKTKNRFADFYNELGKMPQQKKQEYRAGRSNWIKPKGEIIELGCHVGFNLIHYARLGFNITGVDLSKSLLDEAKSRIKKQIKEVRNRITIIKSFIEKLDTDKKYDTILLTETLEHVINPSPIMKKAKEMLKKDGSIFMTSPDKNTGNNSHVRGISLSYMTKLARANDMQIVHVEEIKGLTAVEIKNI